MPRADILACSDSRDVLRTLLIKLKESGHRGLKDLAEMSGLRSPASMSMILKGQRRLSIESAERLAKASRLGRHAARYFLLLTRRDLAIGHEERLFMDEEILFLKSRPEARPLEVSQYRFLSVWYLPVLYAMAATGRLKSDPSALAETLGRGVTPTMVRSGIGDLLNLKLIKLNCDVIQQTSGPITTSDSIRHLAIRRYHTEMIRLATEAINLPVDERELNGVTVTVPASRLDEIKERIRNFRKELVENFVGSDEGRVYQLNIQLFPLTQPRRGNA